MAASRQRSSSRRTPASFIRARSRRPRSAPWARRAEPPRRIVIVGPAHRVAFSGVAVHPASKWRTPLGEIPVAAVAHAELAQAPGVVVDPRPFAGRAFARNASDDAAGDAAGAVRNRAHSGRRRRSSHRRRGPAPGLGRAGDGRRGLFRPVAFSRSEKRRSRSIPTPPGASRRSTPPRSMAAALAASCRSRARSRSPPSATCGRAACIWRHRRTRARTPRGSSATAPSRSNTRPRRGLPRADRERLLSACMAALRRRDADRRQGAAREPRRPVAHAFALARDLRHADRKRAASRLHRFARAASAADRGCASPTRRRRPLPTRASRR